MSGENVKLFGRAAVLQRYPHAYAYRWPDRWTIYATPVSGDPLSGRALGDGKTASLAWRNADKRTAQNVQQVTRMVQTGPDNYLSDDGCVLRREYGLTPNGNPMNGCWVLRDKHGEMVGFNRYRNDLAEHYRLKLDASVGREREDEA